ncbi:hypothetical protein TIFTF001_014703 [Ficus carica]|uniref:Uncharacterized protein n=1 Tax=Ficus carica TaxID=3494 RepID=A0AA88ARQ2_FICCA|nr:hypothetical protein TIFTF001_014703 [Ficus carica]
MPTATYLNRDYGQTRRRRDPTPVAEHVAGEEPTPPRESRAVKHGRNPDPSPRRFAPLMANPSISNLSHRCEPYRPRSVANVAILASVVIPSLPSASVFGRRRGFRRREMPSPLGRAIVVPVGGWRLRACPRRWSGRDARRLLTRLSTVGRDGVRLPGPLSHRQACGLGRRLGLDARREG